MTALLVICSGIFWNDTESRLRGFWRLLLQFVLITVIISIATAGVELMAYFLPTLSGLPAAHDLAVLLQAALMCLTFFAGSAIAGRDLDKRKLTDFGLRLSKEWFYELGLGFALGALMMTGIFLTEWAAGWVTITGYLIPTNSKTPFIFSFCCSFISFILAAFAEEIFSRGYQFKNLSESLKIGPVGAKASVFLAMLISSSLFGLLHLGNPNTTWISTVNIGLAGVMFCIAYLATGKLALPFGLHVAWNLFQGTVFGFPVSGLDFAPKLIAIEQHGNPLVTGGAFGPEAGFVGLAAMLAGTVILLVWAQLKHKDRMRATTEELATFNPL